jgi:glutamyl-tRNA synthetase
VTFQREHVDDQVLIKTDGFPTYHMASVVDDHHMGITHIIRGEEWISSVPKHLVLYKFFGWDVPKMVHLPLILNQDRSKLSKRQNDVAVEDYRDKGYMPEALINYMAMLGWSPGSDQEMFDMDALIKEFSLERLNKSGSVFDVEKLNWFNAQHMRQTPVEELLPQAKEHLAKAEMDLSMYDDEGLKAIIGMLTERITTIAELPEAASYFFADPDSYHDKTVKKRWKETSAELVMTYADALEALDTFTAEAAEETLKGIVEDKGIKAGALLLPTRLTISGVGGGPALFSIMETLGKETCLRRLRSGAETLG